MDGPEPGLSGAGVTWRLATLLAFLATNGFFVASEFALVRARAGRIATLASTGSRRARAVQHILDHLDRYLSACQLGITITTLLVGYLGEPWVEQMFLSTAAAAGIALPTGAAMSALYAGLAILALTVIQMTVGEQAPKIWALRNAEATSLQIALPLRTFTLVLRPFIEFVNRSANAILKLVGVKTGESLELTANADDLRLMVATSARAGYISSGQRELAENVFGMMELEVRHILVPRVDVSYLELKASARNNLHTVRDSRHSRFPLCDDGLDQITGVVHAKDVLGVLLHGKEVDLSKIARRAVFVPDTQPLSQLIGQLRESRSGCAVVVDEHGTTLGLAFLEDALEEIVGPIQDEFDDETPEFRELSEGVFEVRGSLSLPEAEERLEIELEEEGADTIGGHVIALLGRLPRRGDRLRLGPYEATVTEVSRRRVGRLRIERGPDQSDAEANGEARVEFGRPPRTETA